MEYVTYNESGALTGGYSQDLSAEHQGHYIEVTEDVRQNWTSYCANEARDGISTAPPPAPISLPTKIAAFLKKVDTDVDAIYSETIGHRATEYTLAEEDAKLYKEAGYTGVVPESVQSWATAKSQTATWAADDILATATNWRTAQAAIRGTRLLRKEQARVAADSATVSSVEAQWVGFVTAIRASLGLA